MNNAKGAIITAGDMSTATLTSTAINTERCEVLSIQAVFSGSPVGSFAVQGSSGASAKGDGSDVASAWWTTIDTQAITASGDILWDRIVPGYDWMRVVYTKTSGTGTLDVRFSRKGST